MPSAAAFAEIVVEHQRMVYSIALRILGDPALAEEVAQDVFLALYRARTQPAAGEHLRFWLRKAATHGAISALRRRAQQPETSAEEWLDEQHGFHAAFEQHYGLEARLDTLLRALPATLRVPLVLRYTEDLEPQEIAALLEQPVATVKSNLQRGLGLLRRKAAVTLKEFVRSGVPS